MNPNVKTPAAAVENPPAATTLTPEALVEQLRTLRTQIGEVTPLTPAQKRALGRLKMSNDVLQASINVIDVDEAIEHAVGQPAAELRDMFQEANRWTAAEDELRALWNGIAGANRIRRQRIALLGGRAYMVGVQLARDPDHAVVVPHVQEIKRLKRLSRRKKAQTPTPPAPAPAPAAETSDKPKA
jgi:hypothetical protein